MSPVECLTRSRRGLLFVVSAPSGAGKTSICQRIVDNDAGLRHSVSYTTRPQRPGEVDGRDYHFVDRATFDRMVAAQAFVEWAEVHGNCYGTARATLEEASRQGQDLLLDIDVQGARQIRSQIAHAVSLFILPPSMEELARRLMVRDTDDPEVIRRRLENARGEIARADEYDYQVVNEDLACAVADVAAIIRAERCRTHWRRAADHPDETA